MHRIPYGKSGKNGGTKPGPPVFLAHGLTSSSAQWVFGPPEKSLGLSLADAGNYFWSTLLPLVCLPNLDFSY